jgi:CheY-like chemotaxis protein
LAPILRETRDLLSASLPSSTQLAVEAETLVAEVNAAQVGQILVNLCLNANDALAGKPGTITIRLAQRAPDRSGADGSGSRVVAGTLHPHLHYAEISVSDTGSGMEGRVLARIFDPFFTTKARGRGTGLGLAVVHNTVIAYGGACLVTSRVGEGSTFAIYLPLSRRAAAPIAAEASPPPAAGRERILVVDDEADLIDVLRIGLGRAGYEVLAVNDPETALAAFNADPDAWVAVISDQVMPRMKGLTLLSRLRAIRPSLPFILCTGYGDGVGEEAALAAGADAFFVKPVPPQRLSAALRRVIDEAARSHRPPRR